MIWPQRTLTAEKRTGEWIDDATGKGHDGDYWTVVDRDTREQIGSFGLPVCMATEEEALEEAQRFGSKWAWETVKEDQP